MNIKDALTYGYKQLQTIADSMHQAEVDVIVLLESAIQRDKAYIYAHTEKELTAIQEKKYKHYIQRRKKYEPIAYIRGWAPFLNMHLNVSSDVLIPRPETEELVLTAAKIITEKNLKSVLDLGTGSGAIVLGLQQILRQKVKSIKWSASDVSPQALKVAKKNIKKYATAPITVLTSDMFNDIPKQKFDAIIANLPYVSDSVFNASPTKNDLLFEPYSAIVAEHNGLALFEVFFDQVQPFVKKTSHIFLEIGHNQGDHIKKLASKANFNVQIISDYCGYDRIAHITPM